MNPARDFGPRLFTYFAGWEYSLFGAKDIPYFIIPIFAPIFGACFGAWLYPTLIGHSLSQEILAALFLTIAKLNERNTSETRIERARFMLTG